MPGDSTEALGMVVRYGETLEAVVSVLAVIILFMVTNWVFHKMHRVRWNAKLRDLSKSAQAVRTPFWETSALLGVGFCPESDQARRGLASSMAYPASG